MSIARPEGIASCPCLNATTFANIIQGRTTASTPDGSTYSAFSPGAEYPLTYGFECAAHDHTLAPFCEPEYCGPPINGECVPRWCADTWCWVDPATCSGVPAPGRSSYFSPLPLYYSYETCSGTNAYSSFYEALQAPKPPPPSAPPPGMPPPAAPPPGMPAPQYHVEIGFSVGSVVTAAFLLLMWYLIRSTRVYRARERARCRAVAQDAIEATRSMHFWAAFMRASDFIAVGRLLPYEEMRDRNLLVYRDSFSDLAFGEDFTIFISHQWTSYNKPDPLNKQYPVMVAAVRQVAAERFPGGSVDLSNVLVWVDYSSIPQVSAEPLKLAIHSLSAYASLASAFVIAAPLVTHINTGAPCDFSTYRRRTWCRAEQACHLFRNGLDSMWVATSEQSVLPVRGVKESGSKETEVAAATLIQARLRAHTANKAREVGLSDGPPDIPSFKRAQGSLSYRDWKSLTEAEWMQESILVFEGDITNELDKLALVTPILGLYAELYACRGSDEVPFAAEMLQLVRSKRDIVLPRTFRPAASLRVGEGAPGTNKRTKRRGASNGVVTSTVLDFSSPTIQRNESHRLSFREDVRGKSATPATPEGVAATIIEEAPARAPDESIKDGSFTRGDAGRTPKEVHGKAVELFGELVDMVEQMIDEDPELKQQLLQSVLQRQQARLAGSGTRVTDAVV